MKKYFLQVTLSILFIAPLSVYAHQEDAEQQVPQKGEVVETVPAPAKTFTSCSQDAIEKRDTQIAASRSAYNIAMNNALNERKNKEKGAVAIKDSDVKKDTIKSSVEAYKNQAKSAQNTLTQARKLAWQTFEEDIQACRDQAKEDVNQDLSNGTPDTDTAENTKKVEDIPSKEVRTLKETIKAQFETLKSFFN